MTQPDSRWKNYMNCCTQCGNPVGHSQLEYREMVGAWPVSQYLCGNCCDELDAALQAQEDGAGDE